jgi:HEAT repeat protein
MGQAAIPCLIKALEDDNREIRWEAAKILAEMRNPALAPILTQGLENRDPDVRWLSAEGLLALGKDALSSLLASLIKKPTSTLLLQGAHHVLQDFYLKRRHEGETQYYSLNSISDEIREKLKPVVTALEADEPSHSLPAAAQEALDYLR